MNCQDQILKHLGNLVKHDTCNPPRLMRGDDPMFSELSAFFQQLGFQVTVQDLDGGHVWLWAVRGTPDVMFNVHLDTVPISGDWQHPPFEASVVDNKVYGRGVCDIKGAAACLMALAENSEAPMAILFSSDEEGTESCCIKDFLKQVDTSAFKQVVVAEPTGSAAALSHRGYLSVAGAFHSQTGHSSQANALQDNAIHQANLWLSQALQLAKVHVSEHNPAGLCFNLGHIQGGIKNNMIADACKLGFSVRVSPGQNNHSVYQSITGLAEQAQWQISFDAPPLPEDLSLKSKAKAFCAAHDWPTLESVDFWTEAALFSQYGLPTVVLGPGHIAQAHTTDEWVELAQLTTCYQRYQKVLQ